MPDLNTKLTYVMTVAATESLEDMQLPRFGGASEVLPGRFLFCKTEEIELNQVKSGEEERLSEGGN